MTTIAWDGKTLASDTLATSGNMKLAGETIKTMRVGKYRIAFAGEYAPAILFFNEKILSDMELGQFDFKAITPQPNAFSLLVVVDGEYHCHVLDSESGFWDDYNPPIAIGSGSKYAIGSMYSGCDAKKAVEVACVLDTHSGLPAREEK